MLHFLETHSSQKQKRPIFPKCVLDDINVASQDFCFRTPFFEATKLGFIHHLLALLVGVDIEGSI